MIPLQFALELIHAIFVILETIFGYIALRILARYQISRFHYKQFDELDKKDEVNQDYNWMPGVTIRDPNDFTKVISNFEIYISN